MKLFELFGVVNIDAKKAKDALKGVDEEGKKATASLDDVAKKAQTTSSKLESMGGKLTKIGGSMSKKVTAPIAAAGIASFKFAADLQDALGASDQVFASASGDIAKWADSLESYYGIAESEALTYANTMGSMLKNIGGLSDAEAAKQSKTLIELAGDLTAMFGGTTEDAVRALTGALKGNASMLDNYGMGVNQATIEAKALEMGLMDTASSATNLTKANIDIEKAQVKYNEALEKHGEGSLEAREASNKLEIAKEKLTESSGKATGEMSLETKQAATLALVMEQTGDAQGQAGREAEGASGSLRILITELKNLATELGEVLLPIITPWITKLGELVTKFGEMSPATQKIIVGIGLFAAAVGPILLVVGNMMLTFSKLITMFSGVGMASTALSGVIAFMSGPIGIVIGVIAGLILAGYLLIKNWDKISGFAVTVKDKVVGAFSAIGDFIGSIFTSIWDTIVNNFDKIKKFIGDSLELIWGLMTNPVGTLIDIVNKHFGAVGKAITAPIEKAKEAIRKIVDKIKDFFSFKIEFPDVKIPGFNTDKKAKVVRTSKSPKSNTRFFAKGGLMKNPTEFARRADTSYVGGEAGNEGIVPLQGKHMKPMALAISDILKMTALKKAEASNVTNINVASLVVREEADIRRIAEELERLTMRKNRLRGAY